MLPEIQVSSNDHFLLLIAWKPSYKSSMFQATIRPPVVKNMEKALWFQFTVGSLPLYAVIFMGYWAYGSSTSGYLLNSVHGPVWIKAVANISAFLQTVIALHVSYLLSVASVRTMSFIFPHFVMKFFFMVNFINHAAVLFFFSFRKVYLGLLHMLLFTDMTSFYIRAYVFPDICEPNV